MSFRIEEKLLFNPGQIFNLRKWLSKNEYSILYPKRKIRSLYFENSINQIFLDSEEGITPRKKIRLRTYSKKFLNKNNKFNYEIKISSMEGRYKSNKKIKKKIDKIFNGIYDNQYGICFPVLNVVYDREYFIKNQSRITIDSNIK